MKSLKHDDELANMCSSYLVPVKKYVLKLCHDENLADDITAITFLKAIQNIDSFKDGKILTWLCTIAKNTYFDELKRKDNNNLALNEEMDIADDKAFTLDDRFISEEEKAKLYKNLLKLSDEEKDIVYLRFFADLSYKQIGDIIGKSENYVRVIFYRSKEKMKGWMDDEK